MKWKNRPKRTVAEINVVPYIDVMLVLLVIFMITTPLLTQGVKVNLPQAQATPMTEQDHLPIIVTVDQAGRYYLNLATYPNKPLAPQTLANRVAAQIQFDRQQRIKRPVLIKGDNNVNYGKVVQAMALLSHAGVPNVGLMTDPLAQKQT